MAPRRKVRQRDAQLAFEALSIEGGLISPEWLAKVAQLDAGHQAETDYRIPKGLNLRDEIGRYWRMAQAHWGDFARAWAAGSATKPVAEQFVTALLKDCLGFGSLAPREPVTKGERTYPLGWSALEGRVPIIIVAPRPPGDSEAARKSTLEDQQADLSDGGRKRSAFGLAQEFLNAEDDALWAVVCDGLTLRICRDNVSLTRPAWIEADLDRIFREERYSDFAALWLLAHETRFGAPGQLVSACYLEAWRAAGREEGTRAREFLRDGVEEALKALGRGFLANPANDALRKALHDGALSPSDFFQELLRLVYRLIFLLTAEERDLLHPVGVADAVKSRYSLGYGLRRLRDRAVRRSAHDRFGDLWEGLKIVLRGVSTEEPRLGLPALGGLFAASQCPHLDASKLENRALLTAVFRLSWLKGDSGLARVNWRDMGPEELGSVYESLLELVPVIPSDHRGFSFATGDETKGNARKTTGSYYTPDSLVQVLLDSALEPVIQATVAAHPEDPAEALLKLSVVDPACGSGHFLLAAARRLAVHVARHQANGTPSAEQYRHAVRQVVSRCLFGVDLNPMAVELCRVSLWMEAVEPGRPLSFLDSHVQRGNALLGATPKLMKKGIPDAAFEPIEGDDKKTASLLKKRNKEVSEKQGLFDTLWSKEAGAETDEVARAVAALDAAPDVDLAAVAGKEARWEELQASDAFRHQKFVADAWCAAFVWPKPEIESAAGGKQKKASPIMEAAPTNALWLQIQSGEGQAPPLTVKAVEELAAKYHFFHWHLAFPQVFDKGGFDVVLGNPPWDKVKLLEQEFFASRSGRIASAANSAARKRLISKLQHEDVALWREWSEASREAEGESHFVRNSGRFPLCGKGDVNTYALFAEQDSFLLRPTGRAGFIVPTGIATDDTTKEYFQFLTDGSRLRSLFDFQSGPGLFGAIGHGTFKFTLLSISGSGLAEKADLSFNSRAVAEARSPEKVFHLSAEDIYTLNPNTRTCPIFRSARDAKINLSIYRRVGVLWREDDAASSNSWGLKFLRMMDMASDSACFKSSADLEGAGARLLGSAYVGVGPRCVGLLEAKMVHHFDHRFGDYRDHPKGSENLTLPDVPLARLQNPEYAPLGRYWVPSEEVDARLPPEWKRQWLLGWRKITKPQNERTMIASLFPRQAVGDAMPLVFSSESPTLLAGLYACLCSFVVDYATRQKVGGTNLTYGYIRQFPVLAPRALETNHPWLGAVRLPDWLAVRVLELTYTAWDLEPFAQDIGHDGPPFRWDPDRRSMLRAELDAAFFHLYGISRDDADYILDTFPIVRKNDEKAHGEYRTKRVILEIFDAMGEATRTGKPYQTRIDPPPADLRVAHPPRRGSVH